jgi:DNA-binding winged helix-turn-helix (wHTH) protein/TolB-like protein/Flp pilus assembly protein TadD
MALPFETNDTPKLKHYRFGEFELDLADETITRSGERLNIPRRAVQVLGVLLQKPGEIVSKDEFFEKVWGGTFVEENNLTVVIASLRKALGDDAKSARYIENLPRKGYRFVARVEAVNGDQDGTALRVAESETTPATRSFRRPRRVVFATASAIVVAGLILTVVGFNSFFPYPQRPPISSIAVLPFSSTSPDGEYIADGLTDGIIDSLSRVRSIKVIDRKSSSQYKNRESPPASAAKELNAEATVTGQVEEYGEVLVVRAELRDTNEVVRWQQRFRRRGLDVFAVQLEISQAILTSLNVAETLVSDRETAKNQTTDAVAYDLYLKGRFYWNKRTDPDLLKAANLFQAAVERDPTFAAGYVGLADAYSLAEFKHLRLSAEDKNAMVRGFIAKALAIDSTLSQPYAALAVNKCFYDWDLAGADADYRRAIELNPNNATARHWYAEFLAMHGRFNESFSEYEKAIALDPLSLPVMADRALSHYYARDYDKAIELLERIAELHPRYDRVYLFLSYVYREKGYFEKAVDSLQKLHDLKVSKGEWTGVANEGRAKYLLELREGSRTGAKGYWEAELKHGPDEPYFKAIARAKLGDVEGAFALLEKSIKEKFSGMVWLKVTPELDPLRTDPRYQELMKRVGL